MHLCRPIGLAIRRRPRWFRGLQSPWERGTGTFFRRRRGTIELRRLRPDTPAFGSRSPSSALRKSPLSGNCKARLDWALDGLHAGSSGFRRFGQLDADATPRLADENKIQRSCVISEESLSQEQPLVLDHRRMRASAAGAILGQVLARWRMDGRWRS